MTKQTSARYSPEVRARAVRMVLEHQSDYPSQWAAIGSIASKIGCAGETLRKWVEKMHLALISSNSSNPNGECRILLARDRGMQPH